MTTPWIAFSNETLSMARPMKDGDTIECPTCKKSHKVKCNKSDSGKLELYTYKCGKNTYMAGIDGKCTIGVSSDAHGEI